MATGKRYYWIKLKESFMTSDSVDYLMNQPDGANYVVLYQMLCLKTINTDGRLSRQIGEIIIPYDVKKIQRDCKYFSADTIRVALELFRSFGLIYEDLDGTLVLTDHANLVGSETDYSQQKRIQRQNALSLPAVDTGVDNVHQSVHTEIDIRDRDKRLEIRDRDKDIDTRRKTRACAREDAEEPTPLGRVMSFYMDKLNPTPSSTVVSAVQAYLEKLDADVIIHAMRVAIDERKTSWSYIQGILRRYAKEDLTTMNAVLESEQRHQERKEGRDAGTNRAAAGSDGNAKKTWDIHSDLDDE